MEIIEMVKEDIDRYVALYISVFNDKPWNDRWTQETANIRIRDMMDTHTFVGKALIEGDQLIGMIWGQKEQFYNGVHFQIQEFCVKSNLQGKGYGSMLLSALRDTLQTDNISNIYLITAKGERTEGYYLRKGFKTSSDMILMSQSLHQ